MPPATCRRRCFMECACRWCQCRGANDRSVRKSMSSPVVLTGPRLRTAPFPKSALLPIGAGCANARELVKANAVARKAVFNFTVRVLLLSEENEHDRLWLRGARSLDAGSSVPRKLPLSPVIVQDAAVFAAGPHYQADRRAADRSLRLGASGRGEMKTPFGRNGFGTEVPVPG
jgi:hypothetical protein